MANLTRTNFFRDPFSIRDDLFRLMNLPLRIPGETEELAAAWTPSVDIYEDAEGIVVKAEVPGVDPKDIDLKIEDGLMTIKGERKLEKEDKKNNYTRLERFYGAFTRTFTVPSGVDADKVRAETKNGVLQVYLPKKAEVKPRQISVKVT